MPYKKPAGVSEDEWTLMLREKRRVAARRDREKHQEARNQASRERAKNRWTSDPEYRSRYLHHARTYREKNREKINQKGREYHARNRDSSNEARKARYHAKKEQMRPVWKERRFQAKLKAPYMEMFRSLKARVTRSKKEIPFDITTEYLASIWTGQCAVSGLPLVPQQRSQGMPSFWSPSIDRIDPTKGYVRGNVRFVLMAVNAFKHDGTDADMLRVAAAIIANTSKLPEIS